jgi:predicted GIY-YIG superfamily endonuclease
MKDEIIPGAISLQWDLYRGVYFLLDDDKIVYVGISADILRRIKQHKDMGKIFNNVKYIPVQNYTEAVKLEHNLINLYKPQYNKNTTMYRIQLGWLENFDINKIKAPRNWQ